MSKYEYDEEVTLNQECIHCIKSPLYGGECKGVPRKSRPCLFIEAVKESNK